MSAVHSIMNDALPIEGTPYVMLRSDVWTVGGRIVFAPDEVGWWLAHQPAIRAWLEELGEAESCHAEYAAEHLLIHRRATVRPNARSVGRLHVVLRREDRRGTSSRRTQAQVALQLGLGPRT